MFLCWIIQIKRSKLNAANRIDVIALLLLLKASAAVSNKTRLL
jgi:hypothetical protein